MARLREATHDCHQRLESVVDWLAICSDRSRYAEFLARFYGFYVAWEPLTQCLLDDESRAMFRSRLKAPLLRADLRWLGWSEAAIDAAPVFEQQQIRLETFASALGSWYVTEGSTLGGQILAHAIEQNLGMRDGVGYEYFRSYGSEVGQRWSEFGKFLNARLVDESEQGEAAVAAENTFTALENWLTVTTND